VAFAPQMAKIHEPQMTRFTLLAADCASDDGIKTSLAADGADFTFVAPQIDADFIFTSRRLTQINPLRAAD